jgi:Flp pilus assembly protein TadD
LGKLSVAMANEANSRSIAGPSKAVVFHQAALLAHAQNAEASNELGVLLARVGMYQAARDVLLESVSIFPQAANWHNLAVVQHHLGRDELASLAAAEAQKAQAVVNSRAQGTGTRTVGNYHVRVVSPAEFARTPQPAVATNASGPPDNRSGRR